MGGAYVFPGGATQPSDRSDVLLAQSHAPLAWPSENDPGLDFAHAVAAVRETFEEAGVLLGAGALDRAVLRTLRNRLLEGADFGELLAAAQVKLDLREVVPFMHWVTPVGEPKRFDTRFYVARAPEFQEAEVDARETVDLQWRSPRAAVAAAEQGSLVLSPPTRRTLHEIDDVESVDALLALGRASKTPRVQPIIQTVDGVRMIVFPGDPDHPSKQRLLKGATRIPF
jgi:8-oxo-dGTP pyrophosphatase MutT (NUDIX family)